MRFTPTVRSNASSGYLATSPSRVIPALFTSTAGASAHSATARNSSVTLASSDTSTWKGAALPPACSTANTVSLAAASSLR